MADALADAPRRSSPSSRRSSPTSACPRPANAEALERCLAAVRDGGAVPAVTAVLDGVARVGLAAAEHERILGPARKAAERDLAVAVAQRWPFGATTVSASLALADPAGVPVFATGGIGGVHRGAAETGDVTADLGAIAHHPLVTVCAGAKAFLDLARTLEELERIGVPVLGWRHDWFPAFYTRSSGLPVPHRVETAARGGRRAGQPRPARRRRARRRADPRGRRPRPGGARRRARPALADAADAGVTGPAVTPFVLARIADVTAGRSVPGQPRAGRAQRRGGRRDRRRRRRDRSGLSGRSMRCLEGRLLAVVVVLGGLAFAGWWFLLRDDAPPEAALPVRTTPSTIAGVGASGGRRHLDGAAGRRRVRRLPRHRSSSPARRSRRPPSADRRRSPGP